MKAKGLGRGLGALMVGIDEAPEGYKVIDVNEIDVCKTQPRKYFDSEKLSELTESIRLHGVIQPLILQKQGERYTIVAGERRYRAARAAGLKEVPAIIKELDDRTRLEFSIIENIQREDLNPIEEAEAIRLLLEEHELTHEEVSERLGRSRSAVTNSLRLLGLPEAVRDMVVTGELSAGHARTLLGLKSGEDIEKGAKKIIAAGLSVRDAEKLVKSLQNPEKQPAKRQENPEFKNASAELSNALETKVEISGTDKRGRITIEYYSREQLESLYTAIFNLSK